MPTFRQAAFIRRAIESLRAQRRADWELVIVDDGSPDETGAIVASYLGDQRIQYHRTERNLGLGAALNQATQHARGEYLAYLPSDDIYYPDHLALLAALLDAEPETYAVYGGARWGYQHEHPAPRHNLAQGATRPSPEPGDEVPPEPFTPERHPVLVQVMHRHGTSALWPVRAELESDLVELEFWQALAARGGRFAYAGEVTCEWVQQGEGRRQEMIAWPRGGIARYRAFYGVGRGEWINWQPSRGARLDERARYGRFVGRTSPPNPGGLSILLVGELGFNPERVLAFEERGHRLDGLWVPEPETWDTVGPLPFGNVGDIPFDRRWVERVRAARPDVIYALLNWQAVVQIGAVLEALPEIPMVFHFKEGPFICQERGLWPTLVRILTGSAGQVFINEETREWFELALDGALDPSFTLILDGDLPKVDWMTDHWAPKLSASSGEIHTVCPGRPLGLDPFDDIARAGIHVHFYGDHFHTWYPRWAEEGLKTGHMHLHPTVEPDEWVSELSQYDAGWLHLFESQNGGDLRRARWDDLNLPARLGTYAAAGLPWIMRDNHGSRVALQRIAEERGIAVPFTTYGDLAARLADRGSVARATASMRAARHMFAFDTHVEALLGLFRRAIARGHPAQGRWRERGG